MIRGHCRNLINRGILGCFGFTARGFIETKNGHALLLPWNMLVHDCNSAYLLIPLICGFGYCDCELTSASLRSGRDTHFDVSRRPSL
jgi:hypothetical protein